MWSRARATLDSVSPDRRAGLLTAAALLSAIGAVLLVHVPVLGHYFFGDDFVPLADIDANSNWRYIKDTFFQRDPTPNWRFLTALVYLAVYRSAGLNAFPFLLTAVLFHLGTAGLIFWLVRRATATVWPACFAAALFGLSAAPVPTVGQVTAFNNVLAGFLVMLAIVTLYEGLDRTSRLAWWLAGSAVAYLGAITANESASVLVPVFVAVIIWKAPDGEEWWRDRREWLRLAWLSVPYVIVGGVSFIAFAACDCTEANKEGVSSIGDHIFANFWVFLGRLLYPIGLEFPGKVGDAHLLAGLVLVALTAVLVVRGPALARVCAVFLPIALLPNTSITFALAPRYVYTGSIPFAILAALLFADAWRTGLALSRPLAGLVVLAALAALALSAWQAWEQNAAFADQTAEWRELADNVKDRFPDPPEGSRVYVRGGPLTSPLWQFTVLPALGITLWEGDVELQTVPDGTTEFCVRPGRELFVADYDGGRFTPVPVTGSEGSGSGPEGLPPAFAVSCSAELSPE